MIHWEEGEDEGGLSVWLRYVECGHWGIILTAVLPRWHWQWTVDHVGCRYSFYWEYRR